MTRIADDFAAIRKAMETMSAPAKDPCEEMSMAELVQRSLQEVPRNLVIGETNVLIGKATVTAVRRVILP